MVRVTIKRDEEQQIAQRRRHVRLHNAPMRQNSWLKHKQCNRQHGRKSAKQPARKSKDDKADQNRKKNHRNARPESKRSEAFRIVLPKTFCVRPLLRNRSRIAVNLFGLYFFWLNEE